MSSVVSPVSEGISHLYTAYSPSVEQVLQLATLQVRVTNPEPVPGL